MALISATPRPDIGLMILQDKPDLRAFIAWSILLPFMVNVSTAPIPRALRRSRIERLYRPRYGAFPRGQLEVLSAGVYNCTEQGFEEPYDQKDVEIYGGEDRAQMMVSQAALRNVLIAHEDGVASTLMSTGTFGTGFNAAATAAWGGGSDKPLEDVAAAKEAVLKACGVDANTLVIGAGLYTKLKKSTQIQNQLRAVLGYTDKKGIVYDIDAQMLAIAFGVEQVLIGRAAKDTADEGQTASLSFIWPNDKALVCYIPPAGDDMAPHLGRTFVWDEGLMNFGDGVQLAAPYQGVVVETYVEPGKNIGICRARKNLDTLVLNKESGFLITGC